MKVISSSILFLSVVVVLPAVGVSRPAWTSSKQRDDAGYRYYVGRSGDAVSEAAGFQEATRDAREQAIGENFGLTSSVASESYETGGSVSLTKRARTLSRQVPVTGFEQVDFYTEALSSGRFQVWILFRYAKDAIKNTRTWLADHPNPRVAPFDTQGESVQFKGDLEITTEPAGATVSLDGVPVAIARTPLRLAAQIPVGKHEILIEHPEYEPIRETVVMGLGHVVKVHKILRRAYGYLTVRTEPSGAVVTVNGQSYGSSPVLDIKLAAGTALVVELTHTDTQGSVQELVLDRNERKTVSLNLPLKPAFLSVSTNMPGASVALGSLGIVKLTPTGFFAVPPGDYQIQITKEGMVPQVRSVSLSPAERKLLGPIVLKETGSISVLSEPSGASVRIAGWTLRRNLSTPMTVSIPEGTYSITIEKQGYTSYETDVTVASGRVSSLPTVTLSKAPNVQAAGGAAVDFARHMLSVSLFLQSSTISDLQFPLGGVGAVFQRRLTRSLGIEAEAAYVSTLKTQHLANGFIEVKGYLARLGFPIHFATRSGFAIVPELIRTGLNLRAVTDLHVPYTPSKDTETWLHQNAYGASLVLMLYPDRGTREQVLFRFGVHRFGGSSVEIGGATAFTGSLAIGGGW